MYFAGVGMMTNLKRHTAVKQRHRAVINWSHGRHHPRKRMTQYSKA
jgi:hypothetical protein